MEFLRNDYLVALNDLIVACRVSADFLAAAAEACDEPPLAADLQALAEDRAARGDAWAEVMQRHDDFPNTPPAEREWIEEAVTKLIARFSPDHSAPLLAHCRDKEADVATAARTALDLEPDPARQSDLEALAAEADARVYAIAETHGHRIG